MAYYKLRLEAIAKAMGHLRLSEPTVRPRGEEVQAEGIASAFRSGCGPRGDFSARDLRWGTGTR